MKEYEEGKNMDAVMILSIFGGVLVLFCNVLIFALIKSTNQIINTNKQLLILVAGKEPKPEHALRALVASEKPPQGKLKGVALKKKKSTNTNYALTVGEQHAL